MVRKIRRDEEIYDTGGVTPVPGHSHEESVTVHGPAEEITEQWAAAGPAGERLAEVSAPAGVASRRTVVHDAVAARRRSLTQATQILWFIVGLIETVLVLRLLLRTLGASTAADFTQLILGLSRPLLAPFAGIFPNLATDNLVFEPAALVAMLVYFLLGLGIARLIWIVAGEPREVV